MFINLSNHPSIRWNESQLAAARQYGEIVDIDFPNVSNESTTDDVSRLADRYASMVADYEKPVVHVMGEMTLTYALVRRLRTAGIPCLASTTQRIKQQLPDGSFISEFIFHAFRPYE